MHTTEFRADTVTVPAHRPRPQEGPLRVLIGKERFSENHPWSEMPRHWPAGLADHAVALLLALARRLPEASKGFEPGRWGEPAGRSLAGTTACIVGAGAIGTQIARRLAAFDVTVTGVRRHASGGPVPPFAAVYAADQLLSCVAEVDSVIISASHQPGQPPLVDDTVLRAMRPGAWLVTLPAAPSSTPTPPSPAWMPGTWPASALMCSRPSRTLPTPAGGSATPWSATSIISRPPDSSAEHVTMPARASALASSEPLLSPAAAAAPRTSTSAAGPRHALPPARDRERTSTPSRPEFL